jgi:Nif-specific regulatory protein
VPVVLNRRAVGALGVDLRFKPERDYDSSVKFLGVVASMIAQAVKFQRLIEEDKKRLVDENTHLRQELRDRYDFSNIIGTSGPVRQMYEQVAQVAATNTTVLIRGESGTGKELIAHSIHYNSLRAKKPFVKVSCAALPDSLIESELFGYEKGAFTGADARKKGRFELAEGGTLFLDEIGDLPPAAQAKLLRVLEDRQVVRLGSTRPVPVPARVIAATNRELTDEVAAGRFRQDLLFRLQVHVLRVPPLRERLSDLPELVDHLLTITCERFGMRRKRISAEALSQLAAYDWKRNNVRELRNVIERMIIAADGDAIGPEQIPEDIIGNGRPTPLGTSPRSFVELKAEAERQIVVAALERNEWHITRSAQDLGLADHASLLKIMRRHGIRST